MRLERDAEITLIPSTATRLGKTRDFGDQKIVHGIFVEMEKLLCHWGSTAWTIDSPNTQHILIQYPLRTTALYISFWVMEERGKKHELGWGGEMLSFRLTPTRAFTIKSNIAQSTLSA